MEKPQLEVVGDVYQFRWPETGVEMTLERLTEHKDGITAEITVALTTGETPGLLHFARLNLLSTPTRAQVQKALTARVDHIAWGTALEQVCLMAVDRYRTGDPVIDLREVDLTQATRWRIRPYVEDMAATILFADGGTGKSLFGLALATTQASGKPVLGELIGEPGPVMYLDWESDESTHAERLAAICKGAGIKDAPAIYYRRMVASLKESAPLVRKDIARLKIKLVIVDSLGAAKGSEPEGADASLGLFTAARSFGVPWIGIDHISKAQNGQVTAGRARPYGSAYTHNLARLTWSLEQADEQEPEGFAVALTNHKRNNGKLLGRKAYRVRMLTTTDGERLSSVQFAGVDVREVKELASKLPLGERILAQLLHGPLSYADLYERFPEEKDNVIRARMKDLKDGGRVILVDATRWGATG